MNRFKFAVVMSLAVGLGAPGCHEDETPTEPQPVDCSGATSHSEKVVCAANAFMATLSDSEREALLYDWSDSAAKTVWSNLPGVTRNGLALGDLDEDSRAAALAVAEQVLSPEGYEEMQAILAADDYLGSQGGGGGGGGGPPTAVGVLRGEARPMGAGVLLRVEVFRGAVAATPRTTTPSPSLERPPSRATGCCNWVVTTWPST